MVVYPQMLLGTGRALSSQFILVNTEPPLQPLVLLILKLYHGTIFYILKDFCLLSFSQYCVFKIQLHWPESVALLGECLPSMLETLGSIPNTT